MEIPTSLTKPTHTIKPRNLSPSTLSATLLACLVLLPLLGHRPLTNWDEGIYAEVSREALSTGLLVPHWNHQLWMEKPPLLLWITALFFKLFGINELSARLPSALSGVATVALLHAWLLKHKSTLAAWLSTLMLLATFGFLHACRVGETDILLSLGCIVALIGLAQLDQPHSRGWLLFWTGFAIALMTKGAASLVLPITAVLFALIERLKPTRFPKAFLLGFLLFLLLVLPWHLMMSHRFGPSFWSEYFGLHVWSRATRQIEGHSSPWWYYLKVLAVSAPPFVLLYPVAIAHALRRNQFRVWAVFSVVVFTLFTLAQTRLPHYIAPAYPAITLLTAAWLDDRIRPQLSANRPISFWLRWTTATLAICIAAVFLTRTARAGLHTARLPNGAILRDDHESVNLLRTAFAHPQPIPGPLLSWHRDSTPITTEIFYSGRTVQQVEPLPLPPDTPRDRYTFNPIPLTQAVQSQPRLILLDKTLIPEIPSVFLYTPIQSAATLELGSIARRP